MEELNRQIRLARARMRNGVERWLMGQEELTEKTKGQWRSVFRAKSRTEMAQLIQENGLPLFAETQLISDKIESPIPPDQSKDEELGNNQAVLQQENQFLRTVYHRSSTNRSATVGLIVELVNIVESLHQLEELAEMLESNVDFRGLNLAFKMAKNINKEWQEVIQGRETVLYYTNRLDTAIQQFNHAKEECEGTLAVFQDQVDVRILQFNLALQTLAQNISESYSRIQDNRYWFSRFLFAPVAWHGMLKGLAMNVFGDGEVSNPTASTIHINAGCVQEMESQYDRIMKAPVETLQTQISSKLEETRTQQEIARENIQSMNSSLDTLLKVYSQRRLAALLLPTRNFGMFGFFRGVVAAFGQNEFYSRLLIPKEQESTPDNAAYEFRQ